MQGYRIVLSLTKLLGLQWQGAPSKDVPAEYRVRFPGGATLGQWAYLYVRAGLVAHHWWAGNRCECQKKKKNIVVSRLVVEKSENKLYLFIQFDM